mmetsp:Transcript_14521/g.48115  ORF Transcript_14521/g.48115 Transcript_14521/m.48115 type:complete len:260 (+) Transcript_14521:627-1406(+)
MRFLLHQIWFGGFFARADWRPLRLGGRRKLLQFGFPRGPFFRWRLFPRALLVLFQDFQDAHGLSTAPYPPKSALAQRAQHGHRGPAVSPRHCGGARELQLARHVCVGADTGACRVREPRGKREANKLVFRGRSQGIGAKRGEGRRWGRCCFFQFRSTFFFRKGFRGRGNHGNALQRNARAFLLSVERNAFFGAGVARATRGRLGERGRGRAFRGCRRERRQRCGDARRDLFRRFTNRLVTRFGRTRVRLERRRELRHEQ